jgi:hypothetical protein
VREMIVCGNVCSHMMPISQLREGLELSWEEVLTTKFFGDALF